MKFKICGDLEAPDWFVLECGLLCKLEGNDIERLVKCCGDWLGNMDEKKYAEKSNNNNNNNDDDDDVRFWEIFDLIGKDGVENKSDLKALIATVNFILMNCVKYDVRSVVLMNELSQLGLSSDVCSSISLVVRNITDNLARKFKMNLVRMTSLDQSKDIDWRCNHIISSKYGTGETLDAHTVEFNIPIKDHFNSQSRNIIFEIDHQKLKLLINELETGLNMINQHNENNKISNQITKKETHIM